jgi:protein-L-isoaspartate(D-aspartate) O-methyltransferase
MTSLELRRQFFAEEIEVTAYIRTPRLVEALASVPRERFLPPGPWVIRGEADMAGPPRRTPDADPRHVYHNVGIGIDPKHQLFNGAPGLLGRLIDELRLEPGRRVLHVGCGLGYYTAIIGHVVGPSGRVVALDIDPSLAARATGNVESTPWIDVRHGDGIGFGAEPFDAILVNAGVTHPQDVWLDALTSEGRMVLPLTVPMPGMEPIGKGVVVLLRKAADDTFDAQMLTFVAIYSAIGLRDEGAHERLVKALTRAQWPPLKTFRRDPHEESPSCWMHSPTGCFTLAWTQIPAVPASIRRGTVS